MIKLKIKDQGVMWHLFQVGYHPKMAGLLSFIGDTWPDGSIIVTSAYRQGDAGVHGQIPCRGIDLRSWAWDDPYYICRKINLNWIYDSRRPNKRCAMVHDAGSGKHIHLQVHPKTFYTQGDWRKWITPD